jgi:hypothetical protein
MALRQQQATPKGVYVLANHLDAVLAACEDYLKSSEAKAVHVGRLELTAITHVLQARRCLQDLWLDDDAVSDEATMFLVGTSGFASLPGSGADRRAGATTNAADYLIGGQAPAGIIADLAGGLLDVLEARYGALWSEQAEACAA